MQECGKKQGDHESRAFRNFRLTAPWPFRDFADNVEYKNLFIHVLNMYRIRINARAHNVHIM